MGWYVELHCDTQECPHGAAEEGPQGPSVKAVAAEARRCGWNKVGGRWLCTGCLRDGGHPVRVKARPRSAGVNALTLVGGVK